MSEREAFLRAFHAANPAATSRALARGGSYERLAARARATMGLRPDARVLDLACGDGHLLRLMGTRAIGIDIALEDLHIACGSSSDSASGSRPRGHHVAQARAQALPFAAQSFDAITCHLAFMLFDDLESVVGQLTRVLRPGASFIALLGGGPTADGADTFHTFASMLPRAGRSFGDRRASSEAGWRELFSARDWRDLSFERWELDLSGSFDDVWRFLGSSYQLADAERVRTALREKFPGARVPLSIATYCATAIRR